MKKIWSQRICSEGFFGRKRWLFSPNPESLPFYADLPVYRNGEAIERNEVVWQKWLDYALVNRVEDYAENLQQLYIRLDIGDNDPLINESQTLSKKLSELAIDHEFIVFEGDHVNGVRQQFETSVFHFFDEHFTRSE